MKKEIDFNTNYCIKVKLTDADRKVLEENRLELERVTNRKFTHDINVDDEGYTSFQMHDLMYTFGHLCSVGNRNLPFETGIKFIKEGLK